MSTESRVTIVGLTVAIFLVGGLAAKYAVSRALQDTLKGSSTELDNILSQSQGSPGVGVYLSEDGYLSAAVVSCASAGLKHLGIEQIPYSVEADAAKPAVPFDNDLVHSRAVRFFEVVGVEAVRSKGLPDVLTFRIIMNRGAISRTVNIAGLSPGIMRIGGRNESVSEFRQYVSLFSLFAHCR